MNFRLTFRIWLLIIILFFSLLSVYGFPPVFFEKGIIISSVEKNSSAFEQGLRQGQVIIAIDGKAIGSIEDFSEALQGKFTFNQSQKMIFTLEDSEIAEDLSTFIQGREGREHCVACIVKVVKLEGQQEPQRGPDVSPVGARPKSRAKQVMLTVFFILAILFVVSLVLGITKREREKHTTRFTNAYIEAQQAYDEGVALVDLNPVLAQKTLARAEGIVSKELEDLSVKKSKEGEMVGKLKKDIEEALKKALRI